MFYSAMADLVLIIHLLFILFVLLGGLFTLCWRWVPLLHLPAALWGVFIEVAGGVCPLTPLENSLRQAAGGAGFTEGFIEHYLVPIIYPVALSPPVQIFLASLVVVVNVFVYWFVWRRRHTK